MTNKDLERLLELRGQPVWFDRKEYDEYHQLKDTIQKALENQNKSRKYSFDGDYSERYYLCCIANELAEKNKDQHTDECRKNLGIVNSLKASDNIIINHSKYLLKCKNDDVVIELRKQFQQAQEKLEKIEPIYERLEKEAKKLPRISGHIHEYSLKFRKCKDCENEKMDSLVEQKVREKLQSILKESK